MRNLLPIFMAVGSLGLSAAAFAAGVELEKPKKGLSLGQVAESQQDPVRARLDAAIQLVKTEQYSQAATQLYDLADSEPQVADEARYHLAKALYRMGLHHSALHFFSELLALGPQSHWYAASLEWALFSSRRMVASERVNETIAKYATGDFPAEYRDEFLFRLARFHYVRALAIESGAIAGRLGETRAEETVTGGMSIQGDLFADPAPAGKGKPGKGKGKNESEVKVIEKAGGGFSIEEDIFGDPVDKPKKQEEKVAPAPAPSAPAKAGSGLSLTAKEHTDAAVRFVMRVSADSKYGARAKFLEGLLLYKDGKENDALESFKSVVRLTKDGEQQEDQKLREAAFFQLARTHFGAQQPSFSIFYYGKIERETYAWLDALYEASWAEFRLGSDEKALGNLLTLHAPFFADTYYPESLILKAVIYYENCRYPEAKDILTSFLKRYEPVLDELKRLTAREQAAGKYYEMLENLRGRDLAEADSEKAGILSQVLEIALADRELKRLDGAYREVDAELAVFTSGGLAGSKLAGRLEGVIGEVREDLGKSAGRAVKNQLERERENIKTLIQQAIRIDIETSRGEQERIESQLRQVQTAPKKKEREFVEWADDEKLVWPFDGEYWRDELGTYELTLAQSCR